jgi:hypothetical protein
VNDFSKKTGGRNKDNNAHYTYGRWNNNCGRVDRRFNRWKQNN